jgi:hypothetical protein
MRLIQNSIASVIVGLFAFASTAMSAERPDTFASGSEWTDHMTPGEKLIALVPPSLLFKRYQVPLSHSLPEYIPLIDLVLTRHPNLGKEDVANIFASTLYQYEPQTRPALENMEQEFLRGNYHGASTMYLRMDFPDRPSDTGPAELR